MTFFFSIFFYTFLLRVRLFRMACVEPLGGMCNLLPYGTGICHCAFNDLYLKKMLFLSIPFLCFLLI